MAVYKRTYKAYAGPLSNPAFRFLVLRRFALKQVFKSRFLVVGYLCCFIAPVFMLCILYLNQNASLLALIRQKPGFFKVDGSTFMSFLLLQGVLSGLLTAFVGPTLVAPDLTNGALSMYLARPLSRTEYILGKASVLASIIGSITLVPALLMFAVQSTLLGWTWFSDNTHLAVGSLLVCALLMAVLVLTGLAMSAWVRWRIVAGALVLGIFVAGKAFGAVIDSVVRTTNGVYFDIQGMLWIVAGSLFQNPGENDPPVWTVWAALLTFCVLLAFLIDRKLRVCEVAG